MFVNTSAFDSLMGINRKSPPQSEQICETFSSGQDKDSDACMRLEYYRAVSALGWAISEGNRCIDAEAKFYQRTQQRPDYNPWCNPEHLLTNLELINLCWE